MNNIPKWYDAQHDFDLGYTLNIIIGARGYGKTYGYLKILESLPSSFIYARRTQKQIDLSCSPQMSPFKSLNTDIGNDFRIESHGEFCSIVDYTEEPPKERGYGIALSTFANMRGVDFNDVETMLYDEFMRAKSDRPIKGEADAFFNLIETINRNREFKGRTPMRIFMCTNSTSLDNPILQQLGVIPVIEKMIIDKEEYHFNNYKSMMIHLADSKDFAEEKRKTFLYKLTQGTQFSAHALDNEFAYDSFYNIRRRPIAEYKPICGIDGIYIYRHKSKKEYYACRSRAICEEYTEKDNLDLFRRKYGLRFRELMTCGYMYYSEFEIKMRLTEYLK